MPQYDFVCPSCHTAGDEDYVFTITQSMTADRVANCDQCGAETRLRRFFAPPIQYGLSAAEKNAGTTKHRADLGKFMRNERTKRKKNHAPGTREGDSNELWTGQLPEGIKGPKQPKQGS